MDGLSTSTIPGLDKFRFDEDSNRKSEGLGPSSNDDDLNDSVARPTSVGSLGGVDSLSGRDDLSPTVTQVSPLKIFSQV